MKLIVSSVEEPQPHHFGEPERLDAAPVPNLDVTVHKDL
jgi:hypothetical protein